MISQEDVTAFYLIHIDMSNATHRSATDPDCRFASKGTSGTGRSPDTP
jgi:hypothetical protein